MWILISCVFTKVLVTGIALIETKIWPIIIFESPATQFMWMVEIGKFVITQTSFLNQSVEMFLLCFLVCFFFPTKLVCFFLKINTMLNLSIVTGLQPASLLKNKPIHRYLPRIFSTIKEYFWMAAFVFYSTLELSDRMIISPASVV